MAKYLIPICFVGFILIFLFAGCSKKKLKNEITPSASETNSSVVNRKEIKRIPYITLTEVDEGLKIRPIIEVRMVNDSELSSVPGLWQGKEVAGFSALGLGSIGLGFVASPFYASALIVGGILLVALPSSMGAISGIQRNTIKEVLATEDFSALTQQAIIESIEYNDSNRSEGYTLSIIILAYGFVQRFSDEICFSVDSEVKLKFDEKEIFKDYIYIEPFLRSEDAPPPQCALVGEFAENNGKLAKQTIKNFSEYLASVHPLMAFSPNICVALKK
jgi:hypothetical protein